MSWLDLYAAHLRERCENYARVLRDRAFLAAHSGRPVDGFTPTQLRAQAARVLATAPKAPQ